MYKIKKNLPLWARLQIYRSNGHPNQTRRFCKKYGKWEIRYGGHMANMRRTYGGHTADIRRVYGELSADIRWTYGGHMADIRRTYDEHKGEHTANIRQYHVSFPPNIRRTYDGYTPIWYVIFPSKYNTQCTYCKLTTISSTSTVLEGVIQTVTVSRILLCSTHIVPETTPPPSDEDTTPLPDNTPLSPCCDLNVSLTISALLENLKVGEDPFNVLDVGPAIHDPVEPSLTLALPAATSPKVVGPIRRRRKTTARQGMEHNMYQRYQDVLAEVINSGDSLNRAMLTCGVVRSTFFKWRWIAQNRRTLCCMLERATRRTLSPGSITSAHGQTATSSPVNNVIDTLFPVILSL